MAGLVKSRTVISRRPLGGLSELERTQRHTLGRALWQLQLLQQRASQALSERAARLALEYTEWLILVKGEREVTFTERLALEFLYFELVEYMKLRFKSKGKEPKLTAMVANLAWNAQKELFLVLGRVQIPPHWDAVVSEFQVALSAPIAQWDETTVNILTVTMKKTLLTEHSNQQECNVPQMTPILDVPIPIPLSIIDQSEAAELELLSSSSEPVETPTPTLNQAQPSQQKEPELESFIDIESGQPKPNTQNSVATSSLQDDQPRLSGSSMQSLHGPARPSFSMAHPQEGLTSKIHGQEKLANSALEQPMQVLAGESTRVGDLQDGNTGMYRGILDIMDLRMSKLSEQIKNLENHLPSLRFTEQDLANNTRILQSGISSLKEELKSVQSKVEQVDVHSKDLQSYTHTSIADLNSKTKEAKDFAKASQPRLDKIDILSDRSKEQEDGMVDIAKKIFFNTNSYNVRFAELSRDTAQLSEGFLELNVLVEKMNTRVDSCLAEQKIAADKVNKMEYLLDGLALVNSQRLQTLSNENKELKDTVMALEEKIKQQSLLFDVKLNQSGMNLSRLIGSAFQQRWDALVSDLRTNSNGLSLRTTDPSIATQESNASTNDFTLNPPLATSTQERRAVVGDGTEVRSQQPLQQAEETPRRESPLLQSARASGKLPPLITPSRNRGASVPSDDDNQRSEELFPEPAARTPPAKRTPVARPTTIFTRDPNALPSARSERAVNAIVNELTRKARSRALDVSHIDLSLSKKIKLITPSVNPTQR